MNTSAFSPASTDSPTDASTGAVRGPAHRGRLSMVLLLAADAALLATVELFYLPLRFDGLVLPQLGDAPFPLSVLVAALTTPLLVTQAAKLASRRLAVVPLLVWLVTLLVLGVEGPGGDAVLLIDWRALSLLAAGALPAAIALGGSLARIATRPG